MSRRERHETTDNVQNSRKNSKNTGVDKRIIKIHFKYTILFIIILILIYLACRFITYSIASGVVTSVLGGIITSAWMSYRKSIKYCKSDFTGYYRDEIFSRGHDGEIIKRDKFQLREDDGRILSGKFNRYMPEDSKYTNWQCSGFIVLDQYLLSYRAIDDTTPSRGVIIVKLDTKRTNGLLPCYKGKYYKFEGDRIVDHDINLIKIDKDEYEKL